MQNAKPVMVIGATGFLGTEVCRQLIEANKKVRALVRTTSDPARVKALEDMGVEISTGDIKALTSIDKAVAITVAYVKRTVVCHRHIGGKVKMQGVMTPVF